MYYEVNEFSVMSNMQLVLMKHVKEITGHHIITVFSFKNAHIVCECECMCACLKWKLNLRI